MHCLPIQRLKTTVISWFSSGVSWKKKQLLLLLVMCTPFIMLSSYHRPVTNIHLESSTFLERHAVNFSWSDPKNKIKTFAVTRWTLYWDSPEWSMYDKYAADSCPWKCSFSSNRSLASESHVLLFHARDMETWFGRTELPEGPRDHKQIWMLTTNENPWNVHLSLENYNNMFNWTSFPRLDSDVPSYYKRRVEFTDGVHESLVTRAVEDFSRRPNLAVWIVSNCLSSNGREFSVYRLQQHIQLDVFGKCTGQPVEISSMDGLLQKYKFYIAYENNNCRDYITEKFWRSLQIGLIPVVMGDSSGYKKLAPPDSYIDSAEFASEADLGAYLLNVATNRTLYHSYFKWRSRYTIGSPYWCDLCQVLHTRFTENVSQSYKDLRKWQSKDMCVRRNTYDILLQLLENLRRLVHNNTPFSFPHQLYM